eukprot:gene2688-3334_t
MTTKNNEVECLVEPTSNLSISDKSSENSSSSSSTTTSTTTTTTNTDNNTTTTTTTTTEQQPQQNTEETTEIPTQVDANLIKHPLQNKWSLWYDYQSGKISSEHWGDSLKRVISFDAVEDFWCVFNNLPTVTNLKAGSSYHLFKEDIDPKWEHKMNIKGGKWVALLRDRSSYDNMWLQAVMACVGETFDSSDDICGIVYNVRKGGDKISVWTKHAHDEKVSKEIGNSLKRILEINSTISFTAHEDSMKSSKGVRTLYEV